jgi:hypothetical protein
MSKEHMMMPQVNLGERLRKIRAAKLAAERARDEARVRAAYEQSQRERSSIHRTWCEYVSYVITQIDQGKEPKGRKVPDVFVQDRVCLAYPGHSHHDIWQEMQTGAAQLGLEVSLVYCHDGMGMKDWYEIKVEPK